MNGGLIQRPRHPGAREPLLATDICGVALDTEAFDESGFADVPDPGQETVLARFELQPQYCGLFENFSQYVGAAAKDNDTEPAQLTDVIETPGLQWLILVNHRPLYPYLQLQHIVNPWGFGGFPVAIRLDENALVEMVVRKVNYPKPSRGRIQRVGGRITGRLWYNTMYGDANLRNGQFR